MSKTKLMIFILCIFTPVGTAIAQTAATGGSNIGLTDYPGPSCTKPQAPAQPQAPQIQSKANTAESFKESVLRNEAQSEEAYNVKVQQYNKAVAVYNSALGEFNSCMQTYVANGNADMARIKQRLDQAVAAANAR